VIEWVISTLGIPLVKKVPDIVEGWIKDRQQTRMEFLKAQLTFGLEAQRHFNAVEFDNLQTANQIRRQLVTTLVTDTSYPVKRPGSIASSRSTSAMPTVLVTPPPGGDRGWVRGTDGEATRLLSRIGDIGQFANIPVDVFKGAVGRDQAQVQIGEAEALTIAEVEFANSPAIVVFFEQVGGVITVRALFSNASSTHVGNGPTLCETIGRYFASNRGVGERTVSGGSHDAIDLSGHPGYTPAQILAHCIAWFVLASIDQFWIRVVGVSPGLLAQTEVPPSQSGGDDHPRDLPKALVDVSLFDHAEREAQELSALGYTVAAEVIGEGLIGLHLTGASDTVIILDHTYPAAPPRYISIDDVEYQLSDSDWSEEFSLADIVKAVA
jgi:hypothetical protein